MSSAKSEAHALLAQITPTEALGTWSAPGRVNLIGEHTDYNEGFVLPFAIDQRTYAAVAPRTDGILRVVSTFDTEPVAIALTDLRAEYPAAARNFPEWAGYPIGVAWAAIQATDADPAQLTGLDLAFASDVPVGAGLSSSAAIESAAAVAFNDIWGLELDRDALAQIGRRAENEAVGAPTGVMDQMASLWGQPDEAVFLDCRSLEAKLIPLHFAEAGLALLVIDTGIKHAHATGGYRERRDACERGAAAFGVSALRDVAICDLPRAAELLAEETFRRVRHIVTENQRVLDTLGLLENEGPRAIGDVFVASHASMRDDFEISIPELDLAVDTSLAAGAIGARMTGGGFGGAAIALVERNIADAVTAAVTAAFAEAGYRAPTIFRVTPAAGAGRD